MYRFELKLATRQPLAGLGELVDTAVLARRVFPRLHQQLITWVTTVFDEEGIPRWEPLSELSLYLREKLGYGPGPILYRTGALFRSLTEPADLFHIYETEFGRLESIMRVGSSLDKAYPLAFGDDESNLPPRPMFPEDQILHPELEGSIIDEASSLVG